MDKKMKTVIKQEPNRLTRSLASIHKDKHPAAPGLVDNRCATALQRQLITGIDNSPVMTLQRQKLEHSFGLPIQRAAVEDEELMQGKFETAQRQAELEDEELLQGKFAYVQRVEEGEELLQGRFETAQRQGGLEDEELLQGQFEAMQRQSLAEEEEPLQGKFPAANSTCQLQETLSQQHNPNGMPHELKAGIEYLSGMDLSDVKVHKNSGKPAALNALAYAQGGDIHLGPGQEQHLPHEAWHIVQQRQGRVEPTMQMAGTQINDDVGLEKEADVMGAKALQHKKR